MVENSENTEDVAGDENVQESKSAASSEKPKPQAATKDSKMWAMLAHLLGLFTCFIGPLIIWLVKKEEDAFIDDQAKEALNFQITIAIAFAIASLLTPVLIFICVGFALVPAVFIADLIFCIIACVRSNSGEAYRYPVCLRLVK